MTQEQSTVSIFILTYNSAKTVLETLDSIYNLTYPRIELIVSDDCSKDNTVEICNKWLETHNTRFENCRILTVSQNTGVAKNQKRAIEACNSEWIKGIAGDDALYPDCIEKLMGIVTRYPEARIIHGKCGRYDTFLDEEYLIEIHGSKDNPINKVSTAKQQFEILLSWPCIDAPTVFYHKSVFYIPEMQNCGYPGLEDYPMFLRYTYLGNYIYFCDELICKYRKSETSLQISSNYNNLITKCYIRHFFDETHRYYKGIDKVANYVVNIHDWVMCYAKNRAVAKTFHFLTYPLFWSFTRIQRKNKYNRIKRAVDKEN